ncbi:MAG: UDP-4-amino-4-deoxy-L-arabinose--oxoglutarate aminotransferase [Chlamydiae bacterium]|nr:UDP-4-amino-4-deoxy-L-arabinose--oxoglutarate aminotransferase [Chlamydiota bacterium]
MRFAIPRGIIYQKLNANIICFFKAFFANLTDTKPIKFFEKEFAKYIGRKYCLAFPFARTAVYYALKAKNFPSGSEIIMPPITIKAMYDVILSLGLKPVFLDINLDTLCFDPEELSKVVNSKTKAILLSYLYGMLPDLNKITQLSKQHGLFVVEDFSQCLNGEVAEKKTGSFGDVGIYSASSTKTLDTYGGGLLVCDDDQIYATLKNYQASLTPPRRKDLLNKIKTNFIRNFATSRKAFHFMVFPLIKFLDKKKQGVTTKHLGERDLNMILELPKEWFQSYTSLQAKVGTKILSEIASQDALRVENVNIIKSKIPMLRVPVGVPSAKNVYWQLKGYFADPLKVRQQLQRRGVDVSSTSLVKIANIPSYPYSGKTPNADYLYNNALFIPVYPGLKENDMEYISCQLNELKEFFTEK